MPIPTIASLSTLMTQSLAFLRVRLPGKASDLTSFLGVIGRATAMAVFGLQRTAEAIDRESPPNQKTSDLGIITWADISGVPSNLGGYGRDGATTSSGGTGNVTGTGGTSVLDGQQLVAPDGVTILKLVGSITIPTVGTFAAVTPGSAGNLPATTVLTWLTPPTGCDGTVTLSAPLSGGEDLETIDHLFGRLRDRWQSPPKGGANIDYQEWAGAVEGVAEAYVYSRRGGTGTVHVVVTAPGGALTRIPAAQVITDVQTKLDSLKPTDVDEVIVYPPEMQASNALTLRASAFLATGYTWDWDDTGGSWTVASYSGAGPVTLDMGAALPQSLKDAINNGDQPLIQVVNTSVGAPIVVEQVRVLSFSGTVLTLQHALVVAPTTGDEVRAGSYAAAFAAQKMLDFLNALGPSRSSGFADEVNPWDDIASVWGVGNSALSAADTDGTRLLSRLAGVNGLLIKVGAGSPAAVDFQPPDSYTLPPEMARALRCLVTQAAP